MTVGYVLVTTKAGKMRKVCDETKDLKNVKKVEMVTGPYDIIVRAEAKDLSALLKTVIDHVRKIDGVIDTSTAIVIE